MIVCRGPASARGAYRDRHDTRGGMRWAPGVAAWLGRADERLGAHVENVWSWHLDADATPAVTMIRRSRGQDSRSPGRVRIRRQSIAQGMPVDGWTGGDCRLLFLLQAGHGLRPAPGIPCALAFKRVTSKRTARAVRAARQRNRAWVNCLGELMTARGGPWGSQRQRAPARQVRSVILRAEQLTPLKQPLVHGRGSQGNVAPS